MAAEENPLSIQESLKLITDTIQKAKIIKDPELWQIAKTRAAFKITALSYLAVNCLLIFIWYFTTGFNSYFWPKWPLLAWGFGLAIQYFHAYYGNNVFSVHKEYEKLINKH